MDICWQGGKLKKIIIYELSKCYQPLTDVKIFKNRLVSLKYVIFKIWTSDSGWYIAHKACYVGENLNLLLVNWQGKHTKCEKSVFL